MTTNPHATLRTRQDPDVPTGAATTDRRVVFRQCFAAGLLGLFALPGLAIGQAAAPPPDQEQLEQELAAVHADLVKAFNAEDLDLLLTYCHPDVIAVWPNGQVAAGHDGVRKVIDQLLRSDQQIIASYKTDPVVESRLVLNEGRTVVSRGKFNDEYTLVRPKGKIVRLHSTWTVALVKSGDRWQIAAFHLSANAFDNEVISLFTTLTRYWWGGLGGAAGLVFGLLLGYLLGQRGRKPAAVAN